MEPWAERFDGKFKPVYREIEALREEIYKKDWFLWVDYYVYSIEELRESEHRYRLISFMKKIGSDVREWNSRGEISAEGIAQYHKHCNYTNELVDKIDREIKDREPTLWEALGSFFKELGAIIKQYLPYIQLFVPPQYKLPLQLLKSWLPTHESSPRRRISMASPKLPLLPSSIVRCPYCGYTFAKGNLFGEIACCRCYKHFNLNSL